MREIGSALPSEARNVFLRTPEGLETPHFRLLHEGEGVRLWVCIWMYVCMDVDRRAPITTTHIHQKYEIREYDSYTVAYTDMTGAASASASTSAEADAPVLGSPALTGGAFNTLASYLFGACFCVLKWIHTCMYPCSYACARVCVRASPT